MKTPPSRYTHLWNDMLESERGRLMPHAMEMQILHIWQCKQKAIAAHKKHMKELDDWMENIKNGLPKE